MQVLNKLATLICVWGLLASTLIAQTDTPEAPVQTQDSSLEEIPPQPTQIDTDIAAEEPPAPQPTTRVVDAITLNYKGPASVAKEVVLSHIELRKGQPYSQAALDRSVRALFATGFFDNVYAVPTEDAQGRVTLAFELTAKPRLNKIYFEGNRAFKQKRLERELTLKPNEMLDAQRLAADVRKLQSFYEKKGYPDTKIVTRTTPLADNTLANVTLVITEGKKVKIEDITFSGNANAKSKDLQKVVKTKEASIWSFISGSGRYDDEQTSDDVKALADYYRNIGYLEVKVHPPTSSPKGSGVALNYKIEEGPRYYVGEQTIAGNSVVSTDKLQKKLTMKPGQVLSAQAMEDTAKAIREVYGSQGYLQTSVQPDMRAATKPYTVDIVYTVKESRQYTVGSINVGGNTTTKSIVVARELTLAPGDVFSSTKMSNSQARLKNTGYFEDVRITDEPNGSDDQRDLAVAVTEGKTGNVSLGVGFSSLAKASVFGELTQGNFDISNPKNFFRGGGQKLRLYASLGEEASDVILNFEEPWLFGRRLAGGFSLYRNETNYVSTKYDERRAGFEVYLRKRLVELVDGRLGYRRENVDIFNVDSSASPAIRAEEGGRSVSKITFDLTRDTRDKIIFPTRGNRVELNTAWAGNGLGGDTEYWQLETRGAQYYRSFSWPTPQYITLLGRTGTMDSFDSSKDVPLFDRYFLGGPESLRGYGYRKVGPKDSTDEPLGGQTYGFGSVEYAFELAPPVQLAIFYDWGFLNSGTGDFSPSDYSDNWGIGMRILVLGAPLRLDYGIPLTHDSTTDGNGHFWFSFGTRF